MAKWEVVVVPEGDNPGTLKKAAAEAGVVKNEGGLVVYLTDGVQKEEVAAVAWVRRNSKNPKLSFDRALAGVMETAREGAKVLNGVFEESRGNTGELV